jgi:hypothetical protein
MYCGAKVRSTTLINRRVNIRIVHLKATGVRTGKLPSLAAAIKHPLLGS